MDLQVADDAMGAARAAAEAIALAATGALEERGRFRLAISGGSTPLPMFEHLATLMVDWERVDLFQVDERIVPDDDPDRNWSDVLTSLVDRIDIPMSNLYPIPVTRGSVSYIATRYQDALRERCGIPPVLDVVHLGLGDDGHTASWPPGDPVTDIDDWDVASVGPYRGHERVTLTVPAVNRARHIIFLVTGEAKQDALARLRSGDTSIPASHVRSDGSVTVFTDAAAARG